MAGADWGGLGRGRWAGRAGQGSGNSGQISVGSIFPLIEAGAGDKAGSISADTILHSDSGPADRTANL